MRSKKSLSNFISFPSVKRSKLPNFPIICLPKVTSSLDWSLSSLTQGSRRWRVGFSLKYLRSFSLEKRNENFFKGCPLKIQWSGKILLSRFSSSSSSSLPITFELIWTSMCFVSDRFWRFAYAQKALARIRLEEVRIGEHTGSLPERFSHWSVRCRCARHPEHRFLSRTDRALSGGPSPPRTTRLHRLDHIVACPSRRDSRR